MPATKKKVTNKVTAITPVEEVDEELVEASIPDSTGVYWVTPELASLWLKRNRRNRPVRQARVLAMVRDMRASNWAFTGEAIKFDREGNLQDGQHRLAAVIESGETVKMLVVIDLPMDAQSFMDSGAKRSAADALGFRGEQNTALLAATVRFAMYQETDLTRRDTVSNAEVIEYLIDHPDIRRYVGMVVACKNKIDMKPSVWAYATYRFFQIDEDDAMKFFTDVTEMRSSGAGDPANTLIQRMAQSRRNPNESLKPESELALIYRAWNAYRAGQQLRLLKLGPGWEKVQPK